jgi:hypothetical protein
MSAVNERERLAFEQARRWPLFFGLQFFFAISGIVALASYANAAIFGAPAHSLGGREFATAAIGAVLFTVLTRWRGGRSAPGASAA